jgi:hypothetical protein
MLALIFISASSVKQATTGVYFGRAISPRAALMALAFRAWDLRSPDKTETVPPGAWLAHLERFFHEGYPLNGG